MAPLRPPAGRSGRVKQAASSAGCPPAGDPCAGGACLGASWRCSRWRQRNDGVGDAVGGGVVDAADGAGEIDDAVGLAALQHGQAYERPSVDHLPSQVCLLAKSGILEHVVEVDDVGAVKVGRTVAAAQVEGIVAVVEEAEAALFVEGMGPGVRCARPGSRGSCACRRAPVARCRHRCRLRL